MRDPARADRLFGMRLCSPTTSGSGEVFMLFVRFSILRKCGAELSKLTTIKHHQMSNFEAHEDVVWQSVDLTSSDFEESNLEMRE